MPSQAEWINTLRAEQDWLFKKLADTSEGWSVLMDEKDVDVPINTLDATVYKLLLQTIESRQKIGITLPRIKSGVTLSIVAYLVINRLIKAYERMPLGFTPTSLGSNQRILILTKNKKLRDFFLSSSLNFGSNKTLFSDLAIERLNRLGKFQQIGRKIRNLELFAPVTFYHFDNIDEIPEELNNSFIIAEFTENDSIDIVNKFINFTNRIQSPSTLVLMNSFDRSKISTLGTNGFHFVNFDKNSIYSQIKSEEIVQMPSLASSLSTIPEKIEFHLELIEDTFINEKLETILAILLKLSKEIPANKPIVLNIAWNIYYSLKNSAVPLEKLEDVRKKNPWLKSIQYNIDKMFNFPLSTIDQHQQEILQPVWGTLKLAFNELYDHLFLQNKKYVRLEQILLDITLTNKTHIVFSNKTEAEIFKEEMFINNEWVEDDNTIQIRDMQYMLLHDEIGKDVILAGAWKTRELPSIMALMPHKLEVLCYPSELPSIIKALKYVNIYEPRDGFNQTQTTLTLLHLATSQNSQTYVSGEWVIPDTETQKQLENYHAQTNNNLLIFDELSYEDIERVTESNEHETEDIATDGTELIQAYRLALENGGSICVAINQEILVYSNSDESVQTVFPESLQEDDMVLLYSHEQNQEMFQEILQRTRELTGAKQRYIALWKSTIELIRKAIDERYHGSYVVPIKMLKDFGCKKTDVTIRQWFKGLTMAPQDREDIEYILEYCAIKNAPYLSECIHKEMELLRLFNRKLGVRLKRRLSDTLRSTELSPAHDRIEQEIDEILESAEIVKITNISHEPITVSKTEISKYIF